MKKLHLLALLAISAMFLLPACTFQKRVHNRGFHIDWNATKSSTRTKDIVQLPKLKKPAISKESELSMLDSIPKVVGNTTPEPMPQTIIEAGIGEPILLPQAKEDFFKKEWNVKQEKYKKIAAPLAKQVEKEINILSIFGLLFGLISIALIFGIFLFSTELFALFSIFLGVVSIVLSAISLRQFSTNPERWAGKGIAIAGLILGITALLFWLLVFMFLLIYILSFGGGII